MGEIVGGRALGEDEGQDYAEYDDGVGKVRLWHIGGRIGIFESSGGINEEHARFIVDFHRRAIETNVRPFYAFGNWLDLRAYTAETRKTLTAWQREMAYEELHVAQNSKLLAMSVSMANAVLKTQVESHSSLLRLERALESVRRRHRI